MTISFGTENEIGQLNTESNTLSLVPEIVNTGGPPPGFNAGSGPPGSLLGAPGANGIQPRCTIYNFLFYTKDGWWYHIHTKCIFSRDNYYNTKTETNIVKNAGGESIEKDAYGHCRRAWYKISLG